ncbi:hypothetical protein ACFLU5_07535 [Bacteroidota bacterium]
MGNKIYELYKIYLKMNGIKIMLIPLFIFHSYNSLGQGDSKYGYIITTKKDTVNGFIRYSKESSNYINCIFKDGLYYLERSYSPEEILGYGINNDKHFQSFNIHDTDKEAPTNVFLEILISGEVSLFRYGNRFFISKSNLGLAELLVKVYDTKFGGTDSKREVNLYKSVLKAYLSDCEQIDNNVRKSTLNEQTLVNLILDYYRCTGDYYTLHKSALPWTNFNFGLGFGIYASRINTGSVKFDYPVLEKLNCGLNPTVGLNLDISSPKISRRLLFNTGAWITSFKTSSYFFMTFDSQTNHYDLNFNTTYLVIPTVFKYVFSEMRFRPFLKGGLGHYLILRKECQNYMELELDNGTVNTARLSDMPIGNYQIGLSCGIGYEGVIMNKRLLALEAKFDYGNGLFSSSEYNSTYNLYLLLHFYLNQ